MPEGTLFVLASDGLKRLEKAKPILEHSCDDCGGFSMFGDPVSLQFKFTALGFGCQACRIEMGSILENKVQWGGAGFGTS